MEDEIVGKQFTTNNSGVCVVTNYVGCNEVHIKFLDTGFERVIDMNSLNKGMVKDTSLSKTKKKYVIGKRDIVGEVFENTKGESYEVLEQLGTSNFKIKFTDSGYETEAKKINIEIGQIKDRSNLNKFKDISGFDHSQNKCVSGVNKTAKALASEKGLLKEYTIWSNIVGRCNRGYAKLHEDFYTFDSWLGWAKEQKGFMDKDGNGNLFQLDSDLFSTDEKMYSPDTCVFIPKEINSICKPNMLRDDLPRGVSPFGSKDKPYKVSISVDGVTKHIGNYKTIEEASAVSKQARLGRVRLLEIKYDGVVDSKVFEELRKDKWIL